MSQTPDLPAVDDVGGSEADVQEQAQATTDSEQSVETTSSTEVDEFDAAEQGVQVDLDPDEYR